MLISESSVSESLTHIWLPLAEQAARKVSQKIGLREYFDNKIFINSDYTGSSVSWKDRATRYAQLNEPKYHVNVKFNNNTTNLKWDTTTVSQHMDTMVHRRDTIIGTPLFLDPETNIHIIERGVPANIEMECQMVFDDSVVAFDAVQAFLNTFNRGELMECIDLSYDYQLPVTILKDLWVLGQMKGFKSGEFVDWFHKCSSGAIQMIESKRSNNKHHEIVVKKQVFDALMAIDYNPDQPAIQSTGTAAEGVILAFNITLQMTRTNMIYLKYPIVVNNQLVPSELVHIEDDAAYHNMVHRLKHPVASFSQMMQDTNRLLYHPLRMPWYDNWTIPSGSQLDSTEIFSFLIAVVTFDDEECTCCCKGCCSCDCEYKYTTIDLYEDLDVYKLSDRVKTYLKDHPMEALTIDGVYNITVWSGNNQVEPRVLSFDGRYLKIPNNIKRSNRVYRIVFSRSVEYTWDLKYYSDEVVRIYNQNFGLTTPESPVEAERHRKQALAWYEDHPEVNSIRRNKYPWMIVLDSIIFTEKDS